MKRANDRRATGQAIRCAIYTRKSTEHGLDLEFNSLDAQREACEAYIKSQASEGWQVIPDQYNDPAYSGGNMDRPALKQILKDIEAGLVDVVVVYKIDRLTRSVADFAKLVEVFDARKVSFVAVTQQFNTTTSMGRLTLNVLLSFAQFERELASERVKDKVAASRKKGKWTGGSIPLGYDAIAKKLVINPAEAETVRMMFERYLALRSFQALIDELNAKGIVSKKRAVKGKYTGAVPFTYGPLAYLLKNRLYLGETGHGGKWFAGEHEPIIAPQTFQAVQALIKENTAGRTGKRYRSGAFLTGLIYDDRGNRMSPSFTVKNGVRYPFYVSTALLKGRKAAAGSVPRVSAFAIETLVLQALRPTLPEQPADTPESLDGLRATVEQVVVTSEGITLTYTDQRPPVVIPRDLGQDRDLYETTNDQAPKENDPQQLALLHAIARAHHWVEVLSHGTFDSIEALATHEQIHPKVIRNRIRLAFLAPKIIAETLVDLKPLMSLQALNGEIALSWHKQAQMLPAWPPRGRQQFTMIS
jgi:DNA invertase Pin-like site-specific DNA recombinase